MIIQVSRYGGPLGSFSTEEVRDGLREGRFLPTDMGLTEGMTEPKPLSEFPELAAPTEPPAAAAPSSVPPPPVQETVAVAPLLEGTGAASVEVGLPWENRATRGFFEAFFQTVIMVLTKPVEAFEAMRKEGGLTDPLIYAFIGGCAGTLVSFLFSFMSSSLGLAADKNSAFGALIGAGVGAVATVILVPFFVVIGVFIGAAIYHVCLMIVGGANRPFETTFRVVCFTSGSANLLMMIPFCGGIIAGVWSLVVNCIGLARAHKTDTWRAVVAVFLPVIVCCGGGLIIAMIFGAAALAAFAAHTH